MTPRPPAREFDFDAGPFFALRTPLLPFDELRDWGSDLARRPTLVRDDDATHEAVWAADSAELLRRLRTLVARPEVREAIFLAAPSLSDQAATWLAQSEDHSEPKVVRALVRYFARMAGRPTPFGLFAGGSVGTVAPDAPTRIVLDRRAANRRRTRLDMDYLFTLADALGRDPAVRPGLTYRPNSSLYRAAGRLRYIASRRTETGNRHYVVGVEDSDALRRVLEAAESGANLPDLVRVLLELDPEATPQEADEFLAELVNQQVLVNDLDPPITGPEALDALCDRLAPGTGTPPALAAAGERLASVRAALARFDGEGLGVEPARYEAVAEELRTLPAPVELARLFQVDLVKPARAATLGEPVLAELVRGVDLLHRLGRRRDGGALERFRQQFLERYESREVALTEALDDEIGVGYHRRSRPGTALLDGLGMPEESRPQEPLGDAGATPAAAGRRRRRGGPPGDRAEPGGPGPARQARRAAAARRFRPHGRGCRRAAPTSRRPAMPSVSCSSACPGRPGRPCWDDSAMPIRPCAPRSRTTCAPRRPHTPMRSSPRSCTCPSTSGWATSSRDRCSGPSRSPSTAGRVRPATGRFPLADLRVSVDRGEVRLRSVRLGKRVLPRLTSAHNYAMQGHDVYRFLCDLQTQGTAAPLGWDWGPLRGLPALPRVTCGRLVLARAQLAGRFRGAPRAGPTDGTRAGSGRCRSGAAGAGCRAGSSSPRRINSCRSTSTIPSWWTRSSSWSRGETRPSWWRCSRLPMSSGCRARKGPSCTSWSSLRPAAGQRGRRRRGRPRGRTRAPLAAAPARRRFPPGSEWLFAKLYTGFALTDEVLLTAVGPVAQAALASGACDGWFFIRYADPQLARPPRWHGEPARLRDEVWPALERLVSPWLEDGRVWRLQLDTYEREVERYGGDAGVLLAERLFAADSTAVLALLPLLIEDAAGNVRWRVALLSVARLLADLKLAPASARKAVARLARRPDPRGRCRAPDGRPGLSSARSPAASAGPSTACSTRSSSPRIPSWPARWRSSTSGPPYWQPGRPSSARWNAPAPSGCRASSWREAMRTWRSTGSCSPTISPRRWSCMTCWTAPTPPPRPWGGADRFCGCEGETQGGQAD